MTDPAASTRREEQASVRRERLAKLPAEQLAAFIDRLADEEPFVARQVVDLLAQERPAMLARHVAQRVAHAFAPGPHHGWHHAPDLAAKLYEVLGLIERDLLPTSPQAAFDVLADFIARDGSAMEMADDSHGEIGSVFRHACGLFATASKNVVSAEAFPVWVRLIEGDHYGCRNELTRLMVSGLAAPEIDAFVAARREVLRAGGDRACSAAWQIQAIATARRDPDLYAEAAYHGEARTEVPAVALAVARQYLGAGRPQEALEHLPPTPEGCWSASGDWYETRAAIAKALNDTTAERRARWEQFCASPSFTSRTTLLAATPEAEREAQRAEADVFVRQDTRDPLGAIRYFVESGGPAEAAQRVLAAPERLNGDFYETLLPLAEKLEPGFPLAATVLFRALLDSILRRKRTASYSHGAAYWHRLTALAPRVENWAALPPHESYVAKVRSEHGLKRSFWTAVQTLDPAAWARERAARKATVARILGESDIAPVDELL